MAAMLPACTRQENTQVSGNRIPKLVDRIVPTSEWKSWLNFFEKNESKLIYLNLSFDLASKPEAGLNVDHLIPNKDTEPRSLEARYCESGGCTNIRIIVLADPDVEEHVFFNGADPDGRISNYFIVDEYFTQQSQVDISLKPVSIIDVFFPIEADKDQPLAPIATGP
jgi:hypothetical protein